MTFEPTVYGEYEPDESAMQALFARPADPPRPKLEVFGTGRSFNGCSPEEADGIRWAALYGEEER